MSSRGRGLVLSIAQSDCFQLPVSTCQILRCVIVPCTISSIRDRKISEICEERKSVRDICHNDVPVQTKLGSFLSQYIQLVVIPISFTLASFVGIAVTSAGIALYGQVLWDPLKLIDQWDNRACALLTSLVFIVSTLGANISANSLSAGNDIAALYPRYINIRRGQVICAFLGGWAFYPWKILARWEHLLEIIHQLTTIDSAPGFLSFVSGYTVFLGPIIGIMITDV